MGLAHVQVAFVGDGLLDPALADLPPHALLCAAHDGDHPLVSTPASLRPARHADVAQGPAESNPSAVSAAEVRGLVLQRPGTMLVDVREPYEQVLGGELDIPGALQQALPLSRLVNSLPGWLAEPQTPLVFFCRTGNRSAQAAACLRRLGHPNSWTLAGGLALHEPEILFMPAI
jgi:rhodanese-related sulfurtransferase